MLCSRFLFFLFILTTLAKRSPHRLSKKHSFITLVFRSLSLPEGPDPAQTSAAIQAPENATDIIMGKDIGSLMTPVIKPPEIGAIAQPTRDSLLAPTSTTTSTWQLGPSIFKTVTHYLNPIVWSPVMKTATTTAVQTPQLNVTFAAREPTRVYKTILPHNNATDVAWNPVEQHTKFPATTDAIGQFGYMIPLTTKSGLLPPTSTVFLTPSTESGESTSITSATDQNTDSSWHLPSSFLTLTMGDRHQNSANTWNQTTATVTVTRYKTPAAVLQNSGVGDFLNVTLIKPSAMDNSSVAETRFSHPTLSYESSIRVDKPAVLVTLHLPAAIVTWTTTSMHRDSSARASTARTVAQTRTGPAGEIPSPSSHRRRNHKPTFI